MNRTIQRSQVNIHNGYKMYQLEKYVATFNYKDKLPERHTGR